MFCCLDSCCQARLYLQAAYLASLQHPLCASYSHPQVGEYGLVLQLSEQAQTLGAAALRSSSKDTLRDFERDVVLATALAHCGLAREAFDAGQVGGSAYLPSSFGAFIFQSCHSAVM